MIHNSLTYIRDVLNENFKREFSTSENIVVLSNIVNPDGTIPENIDSKIVFFLVNLNEKATLKNNFNRNSNQDGGSFAKTKPTIHLNLQLIFCANFIGRHYEEGLRYLSSLISFFQINNRLRPNSSRNLDSDNLLIELSKLDFSELSRLWSAIGSKIMPSVHYKLGLLAIEDTARGKSVPSLNEQSNNSD
jgi:hypothetical protein